jgi:hypothetical protein
VSLESKFSLFLRLQSNGGLTSTSSNNIDTKNYTTTGGREGEGERKGEREAMREREGRRKEGVRVRERERERDKTTSHKCIRVS